MEEQVLESVKAYFRLVNEEKFDEFFALFHPDIEFNAPYNFRVQGLENVKPFYLQVPTNYPEHVDTPLDIFISGNKAAVFIDFVGKTKDGIPVSFVAMDRFEFKDGKIRKMNIFFDSYHLHTQLKKG